MGFSNCAWRRVVTIAALLSAQSATAAVLDIKTVSSRPDRVSGGDVLVQVTQIDDAATPIMLNGADIRKSFRPGSMAHSRLALVSGLKLGANTLSAGGKTLSIKNYPITGPIVSGPHITPFFCTTDIFPMFGGSQKPEVADTKGFGKPLDKNCSAATKITYLYMPKGGKGFKLLPSTTTLPADMSTTTTTTGATVKFIVRMETATIDRGIYQSTILFDPTVDKAPNWYTPPKGWNHRLIAIEGHGCPGGWYHQGMEGGSSVNPSVDPSILSVQKLGEGYGLYGNTLQNASQSCNPIVSGEAAMMGKEHFIESYGPVAFTLSVGCSGGAYISNQMADALPGLFDGIMTACTFPDAFAIANSALDGHLLTHYFSKTGSKFKESQQVAISGYKGLKAFVDAANQAQRTDPVPNRPDVAGYKSAVWSDLVPKNLRFDPKTNPRGLRPTIYDVAKNVYGIDPKTGAALRTFDNVGVQYGLAALNSKAITADQFLDLNEGIGGYDQNANYVANRVVGDAGALKRVYQGGVTLSGGAGLSQIPVFDVTGTFNDDGGYHYQWYHFAVRERMARQNGDTKNHVMWRGNPVPLAKAWPAFISWVEAVAKDNSGRSQRQKVIANRPASLVDGCWKTPTAFTAEPQVFGSDSKTSCNAAFPSYGFPRLAAGGPLAADIIKCALRPVNAKDYKVAFNPDQTARLKKIFAGGVCDFSKPGVGQVKVVPWASFGPAQENLVYDITRQG